MTQASRPAADHITNYPTSDAGPYSADQWAELFAALFSPDDADQGPLIRYLNELEVTDDGFDIDVDTGAAMVDGHFFHNDASVAFTIPHPAGNPRIDRVVILVNNTNAVVTVSDLGFTLDFPDVLTDYNGTPSVEPYSARLVIVQGTEAGAPVAPGLDQNINHYMIPLYQYQISVAGAITAGTDQREFCYFASTVTTRKFFVPAISGYDLTGAAELSPISLFGAVNYVGPMITMADATVSYAYGRFVFPTDFYRNMKVKAVLLNGNGGNIYGDTFASYMKCSDVFLSTVNTGFSAEATAAAATIYTCHHQLTVTPNPVDDDIIQLRYTRNSVNVLDTVNQDMYCLGFFVEYESKS